MQGNALARATMLPALIAASVAVGWSLWPSLQTIHIHLTGIPDWAQTEVRLGRKVAAAEDDGLVVRAYTGERTLHVTGGLEQPCQRCCFSLDRDVTIDRTTRKLSLQASVPDCPTADYQTREIGTGEVVIEGTVAKLRRRILVGLPVSAALYGTVSEGGCGEQAVGCVSWIDAVRFANRLSQTEGLTPSYYHDEAHLFPYGERDGAVYWAREANGWRLPTEAEWLHAVGNASQHEWTWDRLVEPYSGVVRTQDADGPRVVRGPGRTSRTLPAEDLTFRLVRDKPRKQPETEGELVRPPRERR